MPQTPAGILRQELGLRVAVTLLPMFNRQECNTSNVPQILIGVAYFTGHLYFVLAKRRQTLFIKTTYTKHQIPYWSIN